MMKVKLYLHGHLKDKINKEYVEVEASTAYEALKALENKYRNKLKAPLDIGKWCVSIKDYELREAWYVPLFTEELHIYPRFKTSKSREMRIFVGATIMVAGQYIGATYGVTEAGGTETFVDGVKVAETAEQSANWAVYLGNAMTNIGAAMMMQGISEILFPVPKLNTSQEASSNSKYLSGGQQNTVAIGTRIPFGYGLFKLAGHFLSYNITSNRMKVVPLGDTND